MRVAVIVPVPLNCWGNKAHVFVQFLNGLHVFR